MNILFLASSWPTNKNEYVGSPFFRKRIDLLTNYDVEFDIYTILPKETICLKILRKWFSKRNESSVLVTDEIDCDGYIWKFKYFNDSLYTKLKSTKDYKYLIDQMTIKAETIPDLDKYSLIHAQYASPYGIIAYELSKKFGIPYVIKAHGSEIHTTPFNDPILRKLTVEALENANKCIFVSEWLLSKARELGYSGKNYQIIPNGIDPKVFVPMDKQKIKNELNLGPKVIGFVGNLIPVKRVDKFVEIFTRIHKQIPEVQFLIVGSGNLRQKLEEDLSNLGIEAKFTGNVLPEEVPKFMNAMDLMILPSRNEGWPCVVLEAHACGTPVVGSSNGGIPEAVGNSEFIVQEGEQFEQEFADRVCMVLENADINKNDMISRANRFSWGSVVDKEMAIYKEISS